MTTGKMEYFTDKDKRDKKGEYTVSSGISEVFKIEDTSNNKFRFVIQVLSKNKSDKEEQVNLSVESEEEREYWIDAISELINGQLMDHPDIVPLIWPTKFHIKTDLEVVFENGNRKVIGPLSLNFITLLTLLL